MIVSVVEVVCGSGLVSVEVVDGGGGRGAPELHKVWYMVKVVMVVVVIAMTRWKRWR